MLVPVVAIVMFALPVSAVALPPPDSSSTRNCLELSTGFTTFFYVSVWTDPHGRIQRVRIDSECTEIYADLILTSI